jgi:hypothetical protein
MNETSKAAGRRISLGWYVKYLKGYGIDIGCGPDPITAHCREWDSQDGDAQYMKGLSNESFDWVYSSHCLEHMVDPYVALLNWWRLVKVGGHLIFAVPDEDLYEQGIWPSRWNLDHKWTFTVNKTGPKWSTKSVSLFELLATLPNSQVLSVATIDNGYDYSGGVWDRTLRGGEAAIEVVVRKVPGPASITNTRSSECRTFRDIWEGAKDLCEITEDRAKVIYDILQDYNLAVGQIWECGVYKGGSAKFIVESGPSDRVVRLFDTFKGMPSCGPEDNYHREGDFSDCSEAAVRKLFEGNPYVNIHPGKAPRSFTGLEDSEIGFLHLDVDIYKSVKKVLQWCYPRMTDEAYIVIDDYNIHTCEGCTKAVDEFFADKPEKMELLPLGGARVRRRR